MSEDDGSFLSRWSRRKRAARAAPPAPPPAPPPAAPVPPEAAPPADAAGPAFDPASLPPVESLTSESDFAAFLREEVPAALRRAALRRAWTLDPSIRDFVGPADYAWDFNVPGGVPGFSLDLPGDVERLIAQAVGLDSTPVDAAPEDAPPRDAPPPAGAAAAEIAAPPQDALSAPEHPREERPAGAPGETAPEALPAPAALVAELPPVRRRHGGALPS